MHNVNKPLESEDYLFLRLYSIDLDTAKNVLLLIDRTSDSETLVSLFRDLVVTYCRPFSGNRGAAKKHRVQDVIADVVPAKHSELHDTLIRYRDQLFAHTDIQAYGPKAGRLGAGPSASYPMSFWGLDYSTFVARLPHIRDLIHTVEANINARVTSIQAGVE